MPSLNYNVGIRFDAMGNFMKSMDKFGAALGVLSGGLAGVLESMASMEAAGVAVFAALTKGAVDYNAQLVKMRTLHIDAAQRGILGHRAQLLGGAGLGFSTTGIMGVEDMLYQALGGTKGASSGLVKGAITTLNYMTTALGMKKGAAESRYAGLLGPAFSFTTARHPGESPMMARIAAEHAVMRDIVMGGSVQGLGGTGSSRSYYSLLGKMMSSPWVQGHMSLHQMGRAAYQASALGIDKQEMPIIQAAYGPLKGTLPALFSALGFGLRTGGMLSAISGNAIRLGASGMGHSLVNTPEKFMRAVFLPSFEARAGANIGAFWKTQSASQRAAIAREEGVKKAIPMIPWRQLSGTQRRSILSNAQTVLGGTFFAQLFHATFGTAIGMRGTALHALMKRGETQKASQAHATNIHNLTLQWEKLWKIFVSIGENLGSVLIGPLTAFAKLLETITKGLADIANLALILHKYDPFFAGAAKKTAQQKALERKSPMGWFENHYAYNTKGAVQYYSSQFGGGRALRSRIAFSAYNWWHSHGKPMAGGVPDMDAFSTAISAGYGSQGIIIHNGTFNVVADHPKEFARALRDAATRTANSQPHDVTPAITGGHKHAS